MRWNTDAWSVEDYALRLLEEAGEVAGAALRESRGTLVDELADVVILCIKFAGICDVNLSNALDEKFEILEGQYGKA